MPLARRPSYRIHRRAREARARGVASAVLALCALACGDATEPPLAPVEPPPDETQPVDVEDPWAAPVAALRAAASEGSAQAAERAGTEEGVRAARRAAALARVLSIRDPEADWVARARALLQEASRRRDLPGACDAAAELAELEARDAGDPSAAYRVAHRAQLRFGEDDAACRERLLRVRTTLEPWRPSAEVLARIAADLEGEDPSAELDAEEVPPSLGPADGAAAWAAARAERGVTATLTGITAYTHEATGAPTAEAAGARVVLRFDRVVAFEHGEAAASGGQPRRTWLELPSVAPAPEVAAEITLAAFGVSRITTTRHATGARVTFDIAEDARFSAFVLEEPFRVVLDFEPAGARVRGPVRRIVIDPGHGGDDFGARAFGLREADLTLDLSRRVRALLARRLPDVQVLLTREENAFVSLEQRAAMANAVDADLFLSIHFNAADEPVERGGVTTFVLDTSNDRQARRLAARENGTSVAQVDGLSQLIASLHREEQVRGSRALAAEVHLHTLSSGRTVLATLHDRGVRSAMFYVLVGARMPAVLLEASFLTREDEADQLRTPAYRQALAEGIAEGLARYARR